VPKSLGIAILCEIDPHHNELHTVSLRSTGQIEWCVLAGQTAIVLDEDALEDALGINGEDFHFRAALASPIGWDRQAWANALAEVATTISKAVTRRCISTSYGKDDEHIPRYRRVGAVLFVFKN
jgi:hypothetical protein